MSRIGMSRRRGMNRQRLLCLALYVLGFSLLVSYAQRPFGDEGLRPVSVADAIRMTKLGDPQYWNGAPATGLVAHFSPNRQEFVVVLRRGNLEKNTNEYSVLLWHTSEIFRSPPRPRFLLTLASSSNRPAIHDIQWLPNGKTLEFLGETPGQQAQLYTFDVVSRKLTKIISTKQSLLAYSVTPDARSVAYVVQRPFPSLFDSSRNALHVSNETLFQLLTDQKGVGWGPEGKVFFKSENGVARHLRTSDKIDYQHVHISPNGKYVLVLLYVADFPDQWKSLVDPVLQGAMGAHHRQRQYTWVTRYVLIETATGRNEILLDSPIKKWDTAVAWSSDSRSVVIANTHLPVFAADSDEQKSRKSKMFTVEISIPNRDLIVVNEGHLRLIRWEAATGDLIVERDAGGVQSEHRREIFRKSGGQWRRTTDVEHDGEPDIVLEEDLATSPRIVAIDRRTRRRALLLELNPQFHDLQFGRVEEIHWTTIDGIEARGGLYYPLNFVTGKRYPLVIQTHGWTPNRFWIDGPWTTAFAAQPLAGKGIMVLQSERLSVDDSWWFKVTNSPKEVQAALTTYEAAIDYLDRKGLIDSNRIGIIGFSRTCLYVKYALTHSKRRFMAASVTDGVDGGYFQYIANATIPNYVTEMEGVNGGAPFGRGLESWITSSPGFSLDRVATPLRIVAPNRESVLLEWEWFAGLSRLGKSVDMVIMKDGEHLLQRPLERVVSQQGNVDWFDFWLNDHEDPDAAKAEQYARWRELRKLQQLNENKSSAQSPN